MHSLLGDHSTAISNVNTQTMQMCHSVAFVSSTKLSPDQQPRHILYQQSPKGQEPLCSPSALSTELLCIHFHSAVFCFKNPYNCNLFCICPHPTPHWGWEDAAVRVLIQREMAFCLCCSPSQKVTQAYPAE